MKLTAHTVLPNLFTILFLKPKLRVCCFHFSYILLPLFTSIHFVLLSRLVPLVISFREKEGATTGRHGAFAVLTLSTDRETIRQDRWKFQIRFVNFNITGDLRHARAPWERV